MGLEPLRVGDRDRVAGDALQQVVAGAEHARDLAEGIDVQRRRVAGAPPRRHHVGRPGDVVGQRLRGALTHEQAARVAYLVHRRLLVGHDERHVLRRVLVGQRDRDRQVLGQDDAPPILERLQRDGAAGQGGGLPRHDGRHRPGDALARRDQHRRGDGVVLGLGEQVGGAEFGVGGVIRHDDGLRRAIERVDPDVAVDHALGQRHEAIAGPEDLVDGGYRLGAVGERRDRLRRPPACRPSSRPRSRRRPA